MYNFKKIAALGIAFTMVFGSTVTAFATDPGTGGSGSGSGGTTANETTITADQDDDHSTSATGTGTEDYVDKNVMKVVMPTQARMDEIFDYRLDPQGLIAKAKNYAGTAVTGTATGIVFLNSASGRNTISNTSDAFTITNKSSIPVDMAVTVKLAQATGGLDPTAVMSTTSDFSKTADANALIYLGLKATNDVEKAIPGAAAGMSSTPILLSGESQYTSEWDSTNSKYVWKEVSSPKWKDYTFNVIGAINKNKEETAFVDVNSDTGARTVKNPPTITLKVKLTAVKDALPLTLKWASATVEGSKVDVLQITKTNDTTGLGGFTAVPTSVYINGIDYAASNKVTLVKKTTDDAAGYLQITLDSIIPTYSSKPLTGDGAITAKEKTEIKGYIKNVKTVKSGDPTFYGEL